MRIRYDAETHTPCVEFRGVPASRTRDLNKNTLLDLDGRGNI